MYWRVVATIFLTTICLCLLKSSPKIVFNSRNSTCRWVQIFAKTVNMLIFFILESDTKKITFLSSNSTVWAKIRKKCYLGKQYYCLPSTFLKFFDCWPSWFIFTLWFILCPQCITLVPYLHNFKFRVLWGEASKGRELQNILWYMNINALMYFFKIWL